ncbi:MAG: hypothetical protein AB7I33_00490 [Gemmatimonadales bacterium]
MRFPAFLPALILITPLAAQRDWHAPQVQSTPVESARFQILQSELVLRSTYRLDRWRGDVWELILQDDGRFSWRAVERLPHTVPDTRVEGRPNYQMFLSGLANSFTFLLNTNTGATWQMEVAADGSLVFSPID